MRFLKSDSKRYPTFLFSEKSVFIAKLSKSGNKFSYMIEKPLPPKTIVSDSVVNLDALVAVLKDVKGQLKLDDKQVVIGFSEVKATTRSITLPPLTLEEIDQAIELESSSFLPFPYDEEYLDWMLIEKLEDGKEKILLSAIPRTIINGYVTAFQALGLLPVAFETTSLSLFRLLPEKARKSCLAIEVGDISTLLVMGFEGTIEASSVIQENVNLEDKIEKLINYYAQKKTKGELPTTIYLTGKNATQQLVSSLQTKLKLRPVYLKSSVEDLKGQQELSLAILSSLASKKVESPNDYQTVNVLPTALATQYETDRKRQFLHRVQKIHIFVLLIIVIVSSVLLFFMVNDRRMLEAQIEEAMSQETLSYSPERVGVMIRSFRNNRQLSDVAFQLIDQVPEGVTISGIMYEPDNKEFILSGKAHSRDHLLGFKQKLEEKKQFKYVKIPLSSLEQEIDVEFRMMVNIEPSK